MDDIELTEQKFSKNVNDENFDDDLSAFYSGIPDSTSHEIDTNLDSSDNEENVNQPLIEKTKELVQPEIMRDNYENDPALPEEIENLLENGDNSNNEGQNVEMHIDLPILNIKKKKKIFITLLIVGIIFYGIPKFFYTVEYDKVRFGIIFKLT